MIIMENNWKPFFDRETSQDYYKELRQFLKYEYKNAAVYPPAEDIFNAFRSTSIDETKVVILGQDPYHGQGQAMGLSFSVHDGIDLPPSLKNIYKEIETEFQVDLSHKNGDLTSWTKQGAFLLNACLTVRQSQPNSHAGRGWERFTDAAMMELNQSDCPKVFMLWGAYARKKKSLITNPNHLVLESAHPSPLSASKGFFGNGHFQKANQFLEANGADPIQWWN